MNKETANVMCGGNGVIHAGATERRWGEDVDVIVDEVRRLRRELDNIKVRAYELGVREIHDMAVEALRLRTKWEPSDAERKVDQVRKLARTVKINNPGLAERIANSIDESFYKSEG